MLLRNTSPEAANQEEGYLLLTVLVMVFLLLIALSVAAPRVAKEIQRDKELEAVQRGLQYKRAIRLYYKKFGAYPTDIKQLEKTNEIRFLRKRYKDPITGQDDWRLIHMGQAKVPPMGFFGQPLQQGMSSVTTGLGGGAGGAGGDPGSTGTPTGTPGSSTPNSGSSGFGFNNSGSSGSGLGTSSSGSSGFGFSNGNTNTGAGGGFGANPAGPNGTGTPGIGTNGPGTNTTGGGNTFGGGPIVGVGIPVKKNSLIDYHKQTKYSDWEFVYDPQEDLVMAGGVTGGGDANGNPGGLGPNSPTNSNGSGSLGNSGGSGNFGFGNNGSSGSSGFGFGNSGSSPSPNPPSTPQSNPQQ